MKTICYGHKGKKKKCKTWLTHEKHARGARSMGGIEEGVEKDFNRLT